MAHVAIFFSLLMLHRLCFFYYLHFDYMRSHNRERNTIKNCANNADFFSTAGALVINLVQRFTKQNEANENNLPNAIYKN